MKWAQLCGSLNVLWPRLSLGLEWKLTFSSNGSWASITTMTFTECLLPALSRTYRVRGGRGFMSGPIILSPREMKNLGLWAPSQTSWVSYMLSIPVAKSSLTKAEPEGAQEKGQDDWVSWMHQILLIALTTCQEPGFNHSNSCVVYGIHGDSRHKAEGGCGQWLFMSLMRHFPGYFMSIRLFDDLRTVSFFFFFKDTEIETFEVFPKLSS